MDFPHHWEYSLGQSWEYHGSLREIMNITTMWFLPNAIVTIPNRAGWWFQTFGLFSISYMG